MPRASAFKIDALADLHRQLEYAPPETRKRQMDAAERLVGEIDPAIAYPREFVTFRITGYRPDASDLMTFPGATLRTDLTNLIQRLSDTLELPPRRGKGADASSAITLDRVAQRLGVSAKTIQRYRREGLVCHVVTFAPDHRQLACYEDSLARFSAVRTDRLKKAARFTRISDDTEALIIEEARRLREARPLSLSAAAGVIARRHSRAHETIRQMLRRHDKGATEPIFGRQRDALRERDMKLLHRAWLRGVDLGPMARRFDRSRPAILRAIVRRRAQLLTGLRIAWVELPTFEIEGAESVILSAPVLNHDLLALPPLDEALRLLDWAAVADAADETTEDALLGGWNYLKRRAARSIEKLATVDAPNSEDVDAIETDLRWAARLHRRLALLAFPAALRRIEMNLGRSLVALPAEQIAGSIRLAAAVIRESLEDVDPSRGQRLERIVSFATERAMAQRPRNAEGSSAGGGGGRAAVRHAPGTSIPLRGVFYALDEWEAWLDPWHGLRAGLSMVSDTSRSMLSMRFGWDGRPPQTMRAIARRIKRGAPVAGRRLQKAIRELRAAARQ